MPYSSSKRSFYHIQPISRKFEIINNILRLEQPPEVFIIILLVFIHILVYFFTGANLIKRYTQEIKNNYSTVNLSWLYNNFRALVVIVTLSFAVSILQYHGDTLFFEIGLLALMASLIIFVSSVLFRAFEEPQLFIPKIKNDKYVGSRLSEKENVAIAESIYAALSEHRIFLNPETTISDLADLIQYPTRQVSQVINQEFNRSFF